MMNISQMKMAAVACLLGVGICCGPARADLCPGATPEPDHEDHVFKDEVNNWFHYEQGMRMVDAGNWHQASSEFNYYLRHARMHRSVWGIAYYGFGVMHQKRGNLDAALACYQQAVKEDIHPTVSVADKVYQNIGAIYLKNKEYDKAIGSYKKSLERDPDSGQGHYYLGMSYLKKGDLENAEKEALVAKKLGVTYKVLLDGIAQAKQGTLVAGKGGKK